MVSSSFIVSTYRLSCDDIKLALCASGHPLRGSRTHNLVDHDEHARLRMLHRLHIAVDGAAESRVHARLQVAIEARRLDVGLLRHQHEDVGLCGPRDEVQLVEDRPADLLGGLVKDEIGVDVDMRRSLLVVRNKKEGSMGRGARAAAYQRDGRRVEDPAAHLGHDVELARQAHVRHEGTQGTPLQAWQWLRLGRDDGGGDAAVRLLADLSTQAPQVVDVLGVDRQLVDGGALSRAFRVRPPSLCTWAGVHDVVDVGPRQIRGEGHVEGEIDLGAGRYGGRRRRGGRRSLDGSCHGHVVVRSGEREACGRGHLLPAVASRAGEVGYLVHGGGESALGG